MERKWCEETGDATRKEGSGRPKSVAQKRTLN